MDKRLIDIDIAKEITKFIQNKLASILQHNTLNISSFPCNLRFFL